jgi:hypothetical protein
MGKFKALKHKPGGVVKRIQLEARFDRITNPEILQDLIYGTANIKRPKSCIGGNIEVLSTGQRSAIVQYLPKVESKAQARRRGPMAKIWGHADRTGSFINRIQNFNF